MIESIIMSHYVKNNTGFCSVYSNRKSAQAAARRLVRSEPKSIYIVTNDFDYKRVYKGNLA